MTNVRVINWTLCIYLEYTTIKVRAVIFWQKFLEVSIDISLDQTVVTGVTLSHTWGCDEFYRWQLKVHLTKSISNLSIIWKRHERLTIASYGLPFHGVAWHYSLLTKLVRVLHWPQGVSWLRHVSKSTFIESRVI